MDESTEKLHNEILNEKLSHRIRIIPADRASADALIEFQPEHGNITNVQAVTFRDLRNLAVLAKLYLQDHPEVSSDG